MKNYLLPEEIIQIRKGLKMSQDVFAALLDVEKVTVYRWEKGLRACKGPVKILITVLTEYDLWGQI